VCRSRPLGPLALAGGLALAISAPAWAAAAGDQAMAVSLPLNFEGVYQGDIAAKVALDGSVALDVERFATLLDTRLSAEDAGRLRAEAQGGYVTLAQIGQLGISASYDPGTLEIAVSIPVARQGKRSLAAQDSAIHEQPQPTIEEAPFSATAILRARQRYVWATGGGRSGFAPIEAGSDLAANLGGIGGVSLFGQLDYRSGAGGGLERGNVLAVHDDRTHAIRYSAGDIAPQPAGFQTSPLIGGVSVERQYGTIQPFRNVRPSGNFSFVLDRASTVDLVVNGSVFKTLRLDAGQYNLQDFPFFNGLNQVELYVVDAAGRRLLASFSQYYNAKLLQKGIFEFGATGGLLENTGSSGGPGLKPNSRYLSQRPVFSGYARYGLSDSLTIAANLQAGRNEYMAGVESALATPVGTLAALVSLSRRGAIGIGRAMLLSYEASAQRLGPLVLPQLNLEVQMISRDFAPLQVTVPVNRYRLTMQGRFSTQLPGKISLGISAARYLGRAPEPDQWRLASTIGYRFRSFNLSLAFEKIITKGPQQQQHVLLTLTRPLGHAASFRASYDTGGHLASAEYSRFQADEVDTFGLRGAISRGDRDLNVAGEASYYNDRFAATLDHSLIGEPNFSAVRSQETALSLESQVALAGGHFAIGRPVGPRFAVVARHPSLSEATVEVRQGSGRVHPQARTGRWGPALAPAGNAYSASELKIDVDHLPPGYDIGDAQFTTVPGPVAGYGIVVGSDASRMLLGTAVDVNGKPLGLLGGVLKSLSDPKFADVLLFTNRAGRFAGNALKPGKYAIVLGTERKMQAIVEIPRKVPGVVDVGTVVLKEVERR
jgi:outer membrane usher protein